MADESYLRRLHQELTDRGKIIEAGWVGFRLAVFPQGAPAYQLEEMRNAFFGGAAHLYHSVMTVMEDGSEPTEKDVSRMEKMHDELQEFLKDFELRHGITVGNG